MEEMIKEVLLKELHESGIDQVFFVQNLPKRLIYRKVPKMVQRYDRDGYSDGTMVVDREGGMVEALLDGLEFSQNGDDSILFPMGRESAKNALKAIDAYIAGTLPRDVVIPKRVAYPQDPTDSRSAPKSRIAIPVVELPVLRVTPSQVSPEVKPSPKRTTRTFTEAQKQAARERLIQAREKKKQLANKASLPEA